MGIRTKRRLELETEVRTVPLRGSAVGEREDWGKEGTREGLHELELEHVHAQGKDLEERRAEGVGESEMSIFFPFPSDSGGKTISGEVEWEKGSWRMEGRRCCLGGQALVCVHGNLQGPGISGHALKTRQSWRTPSPGTCPEAPALPARVGGPGNTVWTDVQLGE